MGKINWTLQTFKLADLTDYYKNPRSLSEKEFKQLKTSLDKFGMIDKPIVNLDSAHTVIGGHQRKHVLEAEGVKEVECWIPDRLLTDKEVEELNIRLNKNTGAWDFDVLANEFELDDLLEWGFDKGELDLDLWNTEEGDPYTRNIQAPIYLPKGQKPGITELYDETRTNTLLGEIDSANIPETEKEFLRIAARRHTVFNYKLIAEYYAHAEKETQALMENSGLVIIDFDRAIELGYVKLSEQIAAQYHEDYGE